MPAGVQQKVKLLKLYELLKQETDEDHPISRDELCRRLNEMGVSSNVRTLSKDIEELRSCGYEVMSFMRKWEKFYYLPEHDFSVPELKILIDAVQAASFISEKQTEELVGKIAKHSNETVFYTVDSIEDAIARRKKIAFNYFHLNENAERVYVTTSNGERKRYYVEPVALIFNEDNYYLMAYSKKHPKSPANYRIDRMDMVEVVEESVMSEEGLSKIEGVAAFTEEAFKMFGGEKEEVTLLFTKALIEPVLDKFGEDTPMEAVDEENCVSRVDVIVSKTFFGWLAQFGNEMKVLEPKRVRKKYEAHVRKILDG